MNWLGYLASFLFLTCVYRVAFGIAAPPPRMVVYPVIIPAHAPLPQNWAEFCSWSHPMECDIEHFSGECHPATVLNRAAALQRMLDTPMHPAVAAFQIDGQAGGSVA